MLKFLYFFQFGLNFKIYLSSLFCYHWWQEASGRRTVQVFSWAIRYTYQVRGQPPVKSTNYHANNS